MIRTLHILRALALTAVVTVVAGAQAGRRPPTPPTPPTPPEPPTPPVAPMPMPAPRVKLDLDLDLKLALKEAERSMRHIDSDEIRRITSEATRQAMEASREASQRAREAFEQARVEARVYAPVRVEPFRPTTPLNDSRFGPFYQSDPADSLYKQAYALLTNYNDYRAAALRFKEVQTRYPNSSYISNAMYWQAFSLYRAGTDAELREALAVIDARQQRFPNARLDDPSLPNRIRGALAKRGDASAMRALNTAASSSTATCDKEEQAIQSAALSALMQSDAGAATQHLERVLAKRDECSTAMRRAALDILMRRGDERAVTTLLATAKSDPSAQMRSQAVEYVARFPSDEVYATLESMARTETVESVRRAAARNLVGYPSARARQAARSIIEDNSMPDNLRIDMLQRYNSERGTAEDAAWLRTSFTRVTSPSVKTAIVRAVANIGGAESQQWLTSLSTNEQESGSIRAEAFRRVSATMTVADLGRAYDATAQRPMRLSIVRQLNQRKEPEALEKLIDIVKKSTDLEVSRQIIQMLSERQDPKVTALLVELINK